MKSLLTRLKRKKVSPEPSTTQRRRGSIDFLSSPPLVGNVTLLLVGYEHSGVHSFLRTLNHIGDSEDYLKLYKEKLPEYSSIIQSKTIAHIQLLLNTLNEKSISLFNAVNQELFSKLENINFMNDKEWKQYPKLGQWIQNIATDNYVLSLLDSGHFDDIILYEMKYCFNNAQRILVPNYVPEFDDTIFVEVEKPSSGITEATIIHDQFTMKFIGVNLSLMGGSARKWLHQFQNVDAVVHVLSIGNYDKRNEDGEYKLLETHEDCDILGQNCYFKHLNQVVFFTKVDQMKDKLTRQKIPFSCYPNFTPSERDSTETIMDFLRHTFTSRAKESGVNISSVYFCSDLSSTDAALNCYRNDLTCRTLV